MRKALLVAGALVVTASMSAQSWNTELGFQGGYTRLRLVGGAICCSKTDLYGFPSAGELDGVPTALAAYAIFPIAGKIAVESGLSWLQQPGLFGSYPTVIGVSLRADYAITHRFYAGLGPYLRYVAGMQFAFPNPYTHFQPGIEGAVGYRVPLNAGLNARVELQAVALKAVRTNLPYDLYSILLGVSAPLTRTGGQESAWARWTGGWRPEFGVSAGLTQVHVRGLDVSQLSFPSAGASSLSGIALAPAAPALFVVFPLRDRWAGEVGFDAYQARDPFLGTIASIQVAPRADVAIGRWYAALGPQFHFTRFTRTSGRVPGPVLGLAGLSAAWGYRFHLSGAMGGRFELSYGVNAKRRSNAPALGPSLPASALGLTFGMLMPLK